MKYLMPKGAEELLIAIQTPSPKGHIGIPVLIWGAPGEGKSSFVESLAKEGFPVITLIASIHDPTDFSGLPFQDGGKVCFAPPEWVFVFEESQQGILFLDELTTAPPSVQAALLRVILERKVGFHSLPKGVRVVAAANPPEQAAGGWELSYPLCNRFVHINWELSSSAYQNSLKEGFARPELPFIDLKAHQQVSSHWRMLVAEFLRLSPNLLRTEPSGQSYAFASPRTWDFAISLMASCDLLFEAPKPRQQGSDVFLNLLKGCVGEGAAIAFAKFVVNLNLPDPEEVLSGKVKAQVKKMRDDELHVMFSSLATELLKLSQNGSESFLDAVLTFLDLAMQVCDKGRVDTIFVPMKQMAQGQVLQRAITFAQKEGRFCELEEMMQLVFEETPLKDFVQALQGKEKERASAVPEMISPEFVVWTPLLEGGDFGEPN